MIIEVISPSSGKMDRILKFNRYEKAGVKEYWIVEPDERIVSVFTLQDSGRYGRPDMYTESNTIKSTLFPDCEIDLDIVFD
jgi:Uma2 family endonuclease